MKHVARYSAFCIFGLLVILIALPTIVILSIEHNQYQPPKTTPEYFPITVDPVHKIIVQDPTVEAYLQATSSPFQAAIYNSLNPFLRLFESLGLYLANSGWYQQLANVTRFNEHVVQISPGLRKEQVAMLFGQSLKWTDADKNTFMALSEGHYYPGLYVVNPTMSPTDVQKIMSDRFDQNVTAHYSSSTAEVLPLSQALTIASLIQKETTDHDDMRLVAGIIWNRLFINMNLQIDASLQYAKASIKNTQVWWPKVAPNDKYLKSAYNTYAKPGLPPGPIASPSTAAILATLNPLKTNCLYYFNDQQGNFHCSATYAEHKALLKKYYGQ